MISSPLFQALTLPNGSRIPNRIGKAAMEENLCDANHAPGPALVGLYQRWAEGGAGLLLTGNVMVDARALTGPGGVVLEDVAQIEQFKTWARAGRSHGAQFWMQINHPGRQVFKAMGQQALAPSAVAVNIPGFSKMFAQPRAMSDAEIEDLITRFANTAALAEMAGFTGVEIHAAHGYLLSQFLSPLTNQRTDQWGGTLENRARLLLEVVKAVRRRVAPGFCVAVKLNSADFQRGGFEMDDARQVLLMLNELDVDLVELSGGSYESPAMQGQTQDGRSMAREAYFLEFATAMSGVARMPVMVTGGIVRQTVAEQALHQGVALVGLAQALAYEPDLPKQWQSGTPTVALLPQLSWRNKGLRSLAVMALAKTQLRRIGAGQEPDASVSPVWAVISDQLKTRLRTRAYQRWIKQRSQTAATVVAAAV